MTQRRHSLNEGRADRVALTRLRPVTDPTPTPFSEAREATPPPKNAGSAGVSMPLLSQVDRRASRKISPLRTLPARTIGERLRIGRPLFEFGANVQADALRIISRAQIRLADEYDAAQERGEVARHGQKRSDISNGNISTDIGITSAEVHEARQIRDAERASPGIVDRRIDEMLADGNRPDRPRNPDTRSTP